MKIQFCVAQGTGAVTGETEATIDRIFETAHREFPDAEISVVLDTHPLPRGSIRAKAMCGSGDKSVEILRAMKFVRAFNEKGLGEDKT